MSKLVKKIRIRTDINILTGLHIGGSSDNVEIGGIDNPVIKLQYNERNGQPYIPGSSLRGKIRCLLEQAEGATNVGDSDKVNKLFGFPNKDKEKEKKENQEVRSSKLIVRDAYLTDESVRELKNCENLDLPYTEVKFENSIDRIKGTADNPRQTERVPAGAIFSAVFIINVWDTDNEKELLQILAKGIQLLEQDYLGGNGSRGYGQIQFMNFSIEEADNASGWQMGQYSDENVFRHEN